MLAPKGFTQHLSRDSYEKAQCAAAKKRGALRFTLPVEMGAAALLVLGVWTIVRNPFSFAFWMTGMLFVALAAVLLVMWLGVLPRKASARAEEQYALYDALYGETVVTFSADEMTVEGKKLARRVVYAKTRLCVETSTHFLIFTDDDAVVVLETAAFTDRLATEAFLRDVFARWYVRKR